MMEAIVNNIKTASSSLESFPIFKKKLKSTETLVSKNTVDETYRSALHKCLPLVYHFAEETLAELEAFDMSRVSKATNRKAFINHRLSERRRESQEQFEKQAIIREIEDLEKQTIHKHDKIQYNLLESIEIIKCIHKLDPTSQEQKVEVLIGQIATLRYDEVSEKEKETYKVLVEMAQKNDN